MADPLTVFQGEPSPTPLLASYTAAIMEAVEDAHRRLLPASALCCGPWPLPAANRRGRARVGGCLASGTVCALWGGTAHAARRLTPYRSSHFTESCSLHLHKCCPPAELY